MSELVEIILLLVETISELIFRMRGWLFKVS
jgi:hypothetical protein